MALSHRAFRLARHWSNDQLRAVCEEFTGNVVNVSAGDDLDKAGSKYEHYFSKATSYTVTNYSPGAFRGFQGRAGELEVDLSKPLDPSLVGRFDVVLNHTVLEHVFDVRLAFSNIARLSQDIVISVVPFAQVQHDTPGYEDYWRVCPSGLRKLYLENDLTIVYEAVNGDSNAANYLFFIGSRKPGDWVGRFPEAQPVSDAGSWIGRETRSRGGRLPKFVPRRLAKLLKQQVARFGSSGS